MNVWSVAGNIAYILQTTLVWIEIIRDYLAWRQLPGFVFRGPIYCTLYSINYSKNGWQRLFWTKDEDVFVYGNLNLKNKTVRIQETYVTCLCSRYWNQWFLVKLLLLCCPWQIVSFKYHSNIKWHQIFNQKHVCSRPLQALLCSNLFVFNLEDCLQCTSERLVIFNLTNYLLIFNGWWC